MSQRGSGTTTIICIKETIEACFWASWLDNKVYSMDSIRWATEHEKQLTWSCSINAWFNICGSFSAITSSDDHTAKILGTPITVGGCSNSCRLNWINRDTNICPHRKLKWTKNQNRSPWTISLPQRDRDPIERRPTDNRRFEILIQCVISRSRAERDVETYQIVGRKARTRARYTSSRFWSRPSLLGIVSIVEYARPVYRIFWSSVPRRVVVSNWIIDQLTTRTGFRLLLSDGCFSTLLVREYLPNYCIAWLVKRVSIRSSITIQWHLRRKEIDIFSSWTSAEENSVTCDDWIIAYETVNIDADQRVEVIKDRFARRWKLCEEI